MQLGARWQVGEAPHRSVPPSLHDLIGEQEDRFPEASSWTLTWLEGRPRCALDDFVIVTLSSAGEASIEAPAAQLTGAPDLGVGDDDDDWLS